MIIRRKNNNQGDVSGYTYIQELTIQMDDGENKLLPDKRGNICFIGNTDKQRKVIWKNMHTGEPVNNELSADMKYVVSGKQPQLRGDFVCDEELGDDEVLIFDCSKVGRISNNYNNVMFIVTEDSSIEPIRKMNNDGVLVGDNISFDEFSRVRLNFTDSYSVVFAERFKKNLELEMRREKKISGKDYCVAYSNIKKNIIADGNIIPLQSGNVNKLIASCTAADFVKDKISINDCANIISGRGYMYLHPFAVNGIDADNVKVEIVANRQLPLEIYDEDKKAWIAAERDVISQCSRNYQVKMRIVAEYGDYVRSVRIVGQKRK